MFLALCLSDVFIMLINVKIPTIIGILTFMSRINFVLSLDARKPVFGVRDHIRLNPAAQIQRLAGILKFACSFYC